MTHLLAGHIFPPMKLKIDAHETLPLLFKRDGVTPETIMDNSKEQLISDFSKKLREANFQQKMIDTHSPWSTVAEMDIRELKCGCSWKMIKKQSTNTLWEHYAELEALICSFTAHDHFLLDGEVPETVMKGYTVDISTICEYEWYEWVMYNDATWQLPDTKFVLGRYLVSYIDVGSAMTSKILSKNGEVIPQSTIFPLTM